VTRRNVFLLIAGLVVAGLAFAGIRIAVERRGLNAPFDPRQAQFVGSTACESCHGDRHDSWYGTFHRTMTQEASATSVQGKFDGQSLDYWGVRMRPIEENGRYFFEYSDLQSGEVLNRMPIERTVGSHRYQQYLTRLPEDGTYVRLHYLWHNGDQRWVHMNAAFLGPDEQGYDDQVAIWNQNCIFCHNTGPEPRITNYEEMRRRSAAGQPVNIVTDSRFQSKVAELGISCETCHGPGSAHVERAGNVWANIAMRMNRGRDASIVNPANLDAERSSQVCGQCHAQRTPKTGALVKQWVETGPTYRAGLNLNEHVDPVWRHTRAPVQGREDMFSLRFWSDDTPRLSAYEYQGLLLSACYQKAELSCMDCHTMHSGDPAGQITERNRGNTPCLRCHEDLRDEQPLVAHTKHPAGSEGSLCYNCHMPEIVYGVMDIHRSHRIEVPDAVRDAGAARPNACLNCHLDKSIAWVAESLGQPSGGLVRADGIDAGVAEAAAMLAGDPVQKAVLAYRAGQLQSDIGSRLWLAPYLLEAMADRYPASRRFAHKSLTAMVDGLPDSSELAALREALADFDFIADAPVRTKSLERVVEVWRSLDRSQWPTPPPASALDRDYLLPGSLLAELRELGNRQDKQISIGE
jgi:predicted CXXCH cytochrome family protein